MRFESNMRMFHGETKTVWLKDDRNISGPVDSILSSHQ